MKTIAESAKEMLPRLIEIRRDLHRHPELSWKEYRTTRLISEQLQKLGIEVIPWGGETGVVGLLHGGEPGPVIGLRADIDALPIEETTERPWRSQQPGVMHACGHDVHSAVMLGVALQLKQQEDTLPGRVRILFQPAEETFNGARQLIDAGALEGVQAIFGLHNAPDLPLGTLRSRAGAFYAT